MTGTVLRILGGFYTVMDDAGNSSTLRAQGKLRKQRIKPVVGDEVEFTPGEGGQDGWLEAVLPRRNQLVRPPVANIDAIAVVVAAQSPEPDLLLVDRMLLCAGQAGIRALLVVNKSDLAPEAAEAVARQYRLSGVESFLVCARSGAGVEALRAALRGLTHALGGQSGVGKSTLINALYGLKLETGGISEKIERGKHTTRHSELIPLPEGTKVLDTPGFSLLELSERDPLELEQLYPEFARYAGQCRFSPCAHLTEPDCAVRRAVEEGSLSRERWERYGLLYEEMKIRWRDRYD